MRWTRPRLLSWLSAVVLVAVAATGLRLSEAGDDAQVLTGRIGEPVAVRDGELRVEAVRPATQLVRYGDVADRTDGVFLLVSLTLSATGAEDLAFGRLTLRSGDRSYTAYGTDGIRTAAGFSTTRETVFEVGPTRMADVVLQAEPSEVVSGYQQHVRIHLGITAGNAAAWRAAGTDQRAEPATERTEGLR